MRIGFVGLGDQGGPMPLRLLEAGHDVTIWARRPDACAPFVEAGAKVAPDLQTLGSNRIGSAFACSTMPACGRFAR